MGSVYLLQFACGQVDLFELRMHSNSFLFQLSFPYSPRIPRPNMFDNTAAIPAASGRLFAVAPMMDGNDNLMKSIS